MKTIGIHKNQGQHAQKNVLGLYQFSKLFEIAQAIGEFKEKDWRRTQTIHPLRIIYKKNSGAQIV